MTPEQKIIALAHAEKALSMREETQRRYAEKNQHNSFASWGNQKCMSRLYDTIDAMQSGTASDNQYRYWLNH